MVENWLRYEQNIPKGIIGMFCSYLSQFSTVLVENWTVGKVAGIRTLTRTRTRRYPYPKPAGVAKPLQFPRQQQSSFVNEALFVQLLSLFDDSILRFLILLDLIEYMLSTL